MNQEEKRIKGLNFSELAKYERRNASELKSYKAKFEKNKAERLERDKDRIQYAGRWTEDLKAEVQILHEISIREKRAKWIKERRQELAKPKTAQEATRLFLYRLNEGHKKHAQDRAKNR